MLSVAVQEKAKNGEIIHGQQRSLVTTGHNMPAVFGSSLGRGEVMEEMPEVGSWGAWFQIGGKHQQRLRWTRDTMGGRELLVFRERTDPARR